MERKLEGSRSEITEWLRSDFPEASSPKNGSLSIFQQLLIISQQRQDRFAAAASIFIAKVAEVPETTENGLEMILKLGGPDTPRLLILSGGVDPTSDIESLAAKYDCKLIQLALEENNDSSFLTFKDCLKNGTWLLLKNCHLAPLWLDKLESELSRDNIHKDFKLWLTAEAVDNFSKTILRRSVKLSVEAPPGLRR